MKKLSLLLAFLLGACAGTAAHVVASGEAATANAKAPAAEPSSAAVTPTPIAATVVPLSEAETRIAPSGKAKITFLARGLNAFLGLLEMEAGAKVPEHRDSTEEYIHVLEGDGTIVIDGVMYAVEPGTTIFMPANAKVSFQGGEHPLKALQVFAGPEPAAKYDRWTR
ncbi:MAG: cupin domain-containing protein [Deltaproteobacteria bacterium]|nr:MAG: cupin domain-containing protein [Deltaproteobacteria bacterium]